MILTNVAKLLRDLFHSNTPPDGARVAEIAAALEQKVLAFVDNMPALPDTVSRALAMADDPNAKLVTFARLIEGDAAIATAILRISNSALFAAGAQTLNLQQAVARLGMRQCKNLIVTIGMKSVFKGLGSATKTQVETLWHHGYVTAHLCRQINRVCRLGFNGEEFSAGLLHDLGRMVLALADKECFERAGEMDFNEGPDRLAREKAAIGIDHCALGGWFGVHSNLPDALVQTIRMHHDPDLTGEAKKLVALVAAADHMANHIQLKTATIYKPEANPGLAALWAAWPPERRQPLINELPVLMDESLSAAQEQTIS